MTASTSHIISLEQAGTLAGLFFERVRRTADLDAYRFFDNDKNQWQTLSWDDAGKQVARWQAAFADEELQPGDRIAIMMNNRPEWVFMDIAAMANGLVTVPLYTQDRAENIAYVIADSGTKILFIGHQEHWDCLFPVLDKLDFLNRIISVDPIDTAGQPNPKLKTVGEWLPDLGQPPPEVLFDKDSLASIVYTSGTTGRPKGVMLSHYNILWNTWTSLNLVPIHYNEVFLSFLPLSHTLERTAGYYLPMMAGAAVAYNRAIPLLAEDLLEIQPDLMISVPRIFERVYNKIQQGLAEKSSIARWLFARAVNIGWRKFEYQQGRASWHPSLLFWPILNKLVASKVMAKLGGNLKMTVVGGAPLPFDVARLFIGLGLPMLQGYGLTETSPVISVNTPENNDPASVGVILPGIETRIGDKDELLVKTPSAMSGYWNNQKASDEIIDAEGWLHTGDKARIEAGYLYITGRLKEIIVLANGEKVPPADMEMAICGDTLFEQAMVIGEGRPFLSALVVLNEEQWPVIAKQAGVDSNDPMACKSDRINNIIIARIAQRLTNFPGYAAIRQVNCQREPWSIENGLMTPTLKIKRNIVCKTFEDSIETMYAGHH
ncbi:MAG: long-chain fatty acid--CoA ligase [Gammaproteobacteria bacterium]